MCPFLPQLAGAQMPTCGRGAKNGPEVGGPRAILARKNGAIGPFSRVINDSVFPNFMTNQVRIRRRR